MLSDVQSLVDDLVRDSLSQVTATQRDTAIVLALARYSADRPRAGVAAVTAPGGWRLPLPAGWTPASRVVSVEWPVGQNPPATVAHSVHRGLDGEAILVEVDLPAGATAHVHFTGFHVVSDTEDTVPGEHREALAAYAAALLFDQLAAAAAGNGEPTIHADSVDHKSQAQEYAGRARANRTRYADVLGIGAGPAAAKPASATTAWPSRRRFPGAGAVRR